MAINKLSRLMDEYSHTLGLLKSDQLSPPTRKILEALKVDLEKKILEEEKEIER